MGLLEDLETSLINFRFVMIYIIHKMLVLLHNNLNYHKVNIFECFFKEYGRHLLFFLIIFFLTHNVEKFKSRKRKHNKGIKRYIKVYENCLD